MARSDRLVAQLGRRSLGTELVILNCEQSGRYEFVDRWRGSIAISRPIVPNLFDCLIQGRSVNAASTYQFPRQGVPTIGRPRSRSIWAPISLVVVALLKGLGAKARSETWTVGPAVIRELQAGFDGVGRAFSVIWEYRSACIDRVRTECSHSDSKFLRRACTGWNPDHATYGADRVRQELRKLSAVRR